LGKFSNRSPNAADQPAAANKSLAPGQRILGIDPGLLITGYAVLEKGTARPRVLEAGFVRAEADPTTPDLARRIHSLYTSIDEIVKHFRPAAMAVEQLYAHYDHPRTAILMAHARGVIFLAAAQNDVPVISYNATRIKKSITGNGRAPKDQVQRTVQRELGLAKIPEPSDVADALAAALCHYYVLALTHEGRS
jgi:crossover junction endodeoxyribonuclease RuvC